MSNEKLRVLSDGPAIMPTEGFDSLGYVIFRDVISKIVLDSDLDNCFCIGLYGQYGSGKTTVLDWIYREMGNQSAVVPVWFNPWRFTREEHLIVPFFHTLVAALREYVDPNQTTTDKALEEARSLLSTMAKVPLAFAYGMQAELSIPWLAKLRFDVAKSMDKGKEEVQEADKKKQPLVETLKVYQSLYYRLTEELKEVKGKNLRVVVCIDDLDRCLPERAIELLEGVKVFLDLPGFYFIIGVDERVIRDGIRVRYKDFALKEGDEIPVKPREYLEKIIQIPIRLPKPELSRMLDLIQVHTKETPLLERYCSIIAEVMERKPRACKMAVNLMTVNLALAEARKKLEEDFGYEPDLLAKWTLLQFHAHQNLISWAEKRPILLYELQEYHSNENLEEPSAGSLDKLPSWVQKVPGINDEAVRILLRKDETGNLKSFPNDTEAIRSIIELASASRIEEKIEESTTVENSVMDFHRLPWKLIPGRNFEMLAYPVTQRFYFQVMGENPSNFPGEGREDRPVERVTWFDAVKFCNKLSKKLKMQELYEIDEENEKVKWDAGKMGVRLPTEKEWEYACQAGSIEDRYGPVDEIAWHKSNSDGETHPVGQKKPNAWDLYDMLGNVWEWCWDWYDESEKGRVVRGVSYSNSTSSFRASLRFPWPPEKSGHDIGFRICREIIKVKSLD